MEKYNRNHLKNIEVIVSEKTGTDIAGNARCSTSRRRMRRTAFAAACIVCIAALSAFGYAEFSSLDEDDLSLGAAYKGDGKFDIVISNFSDKKLKLQDKVKVMKWSTGEEVAGKNEKIKMSDMTIEPHSQGVVKIDISDGYDVAAMESGLSDSDWYYFVLTNNSFAFGQDWMCSFDFEKEETEAVIQRGKEAEERDNVRTADGLLGSGSENNAEAGAAKNESVPQTGAKSGAPPLAFADWQWPTVSTAVSNRFSAGGAVGGESAGGSGSADTVSDHINIAGASGDEIYAVSDGTVSDTGFAAAAGNYIVLDLGGGITAKYGHLKDISVSAGDAVTKGQVIGTLGKSGMATGENLSFTVTKDGKAVNPLSE